MKIEKFMENTHIREISKVIKETKLKSWSTIFIVYVLQMHKGFKSNTDDHRIEKWKREIGQRDNKTTKEKKIEALH